MDNNLGRVLRLCCGMVCRLFCSIGFLGRVSLGDLWLGRRRLFYFLFDWR